METLQAQLTSDVQKVREEAALKAEQVKRVFEVTIEHLRLQRNAHADEVVCLRTDIAMARDFNSDLEIRYRQLQSLYQESLERIQELELQIRHLTE